MDSRENTIWDVKDLLYELELYMEDRGDYCSDTGPNKEMGYACKLRDARFSLERLLD